MTDRRMPNPEEYQLIISFDANEAAELAIAAMMDDARARLVLTHRISYAIEKTVLDFLGGDSVAFKFPVNAVECVV